MSDNTFTAEWHIANLERETADGFVYTAHYTIDAKDDVYSAGAYGSIGFERPEELVPFSELTEEQVIDWVKEALGSDKVLEIGQALLNQLEEQRNPTKAAGLPWS
jgi:hypothetical protein